MWVCRLPVHIAPAGCTAFTEILGEFVTSHWADRVVGPYGEASMHTYPVGADDSVRPQTAPVFTGISGESVAAQRADVGIGPLHDSGKFVLPRKFRMQGVFTAIIQRQLLSNLVYRNRRRVPNRP